MNIKFDELIKIDIDLQTVEYQLTMEAYMLKKVSFSYIQATKRKKRNAMVNSDAKLL